MGKNYNNPNPYPTSTITQLFIVSALNKTLVTTGINGEIKASAAKKWKINKEKNQYQFEIDTNITFHNNVKLTCLNVRQSFQKVKNLQKNKRKDFFESIKNISCKNNSLIIDLFTAKKSFLEELSSLDLAISLFHYLHQFQGVVLPEILQTSVYIHHERSVLFPSF